MFLRSFPSGVWQANCYVLAAAAGEQCVIVDPGQDSAGGVRDVVSGNRLDPRAILLTHGHFDHVADAALLAEEYHVAVYIDPADEHLLSNPAAGLNADGAALVRQFVGPSMHPPSQVEHYPISRALTLAQFSFTVLSAPGHTAGSVLLRLDNDRNSPGQRLTFCGDVVFAGSIGRTDLPGGDPAAMGRTLARVVLPLADDTALLPGHGRGTTMARERVSNPYLQTSYLRN